MSMILRNARIIDGKGDVLDRGYVVVEGDRIERVGKGSGPEKRINDMSIDLEGGTLLPGIIDCHVHFCLDGDADPAPSFQKTSPFMFTLRAARNAHRTLLAGVTTARDMGGIDGVPLALRDAIHTGVAIGPRILSSNQAICITGGQGWQFSRQADGADQVRQAVREQLRSGADAIKMMATGGVITQGVEAGAPQFTFEELKAGAEEAHKAGRRIAAHAQGNEGLVNSLRAGFDTIEHGIGVDEKALALLIEKGAAVIPTLSAPTHILEKGEKSGIPRFVIEKTLRVTDNHVESVKRAYQAGVPIAMGTDAGTPFNLHGENLKELEFMVGIGLSPMEAILSATRVASEALGLSDRIGTIEPGKLADLIVVKGDPLKDIAVLQRKDNLVLVMKDGQFYKRSI